MTVRVPMLMFMRMLVAMRMTMFVVVIVSMPVLMFSLGLNVPACSPGHQNGQANDQYCRAELKIGFRRGGIPVAAVVQRQGREQPDDEAMRKGCAKAEKDGLP